MKDYIPYLMHIIDKCEFIERSLGDKNFEEFIEDDILRRAIVRSLEIIGEASKSMEERG